MIMNLFLRRLLHLRPSLPPPFSSSIHRLLSTKESEPRHQVKFLIKEVGSHKLHVVQYPSLLKLSLEKRLIPCSLVWKLLESKGFPVAKTNFFSFANVNEKRFMEKFIHPYEYAILGLHQAYTDACSGKTSAKE